MLLIDADAQGSLTASLGFQEPDKLDVSLATIMANIINEEDMEPDYGILKHDEGVDLMPRQYRVVGIGSITGKCHEQGACASYLYGTAERKV